MAQRQLRILHALGAMDPGGIETWLLNVLKNIDGHQFQFDFCTFGRQPGLYAPEIERAGGKILQCPKGRNLWSFPWRFRRILREGNYDVIHSHVHFFSGALLRWSKLEGVPMRIAHSHTSRDDRPNTAARASYRRLMRSWIDRYATDGLANSRPAAGQLFGESWQVDHRFRILYYGIDLRFFQEPVVRDEVRQELSIPIETPVVGHVGNFVPAKNHGFLLRIATEVLKTRPEIHFLFIGDGPLRPDMEAQARAAGLSSNVHFVGRRTDVPRLLRGAMDLFLFPSKYEGFGLSLLEAQTAGLNCLVSDAVPEEVVLLPGSLKCLPLSAGATCWAAHLLRMADTPRPDLGFALAKASQSQFSIRESALNLMRIYQRSTEPIIAEDHV